MAILQVEKLEVRYGKIRAVRGVTLAVNDGATLAVLGANGAGKSSLLAAVSGTIRPFAGKVIFAGVDITGLPAHRVLAAGLAHVPEGRATIAPLTVRDNLLMGAFIAPQREIPDRLERMLTLFPALERRLGALAGSLSGGEQQMLAIARGLMSNPKLLAIDEPSMGLAPTVADDVLRALAEVNRGGTAVLLIEQNAAIALRLAEEVVILGHGEVQAQGTASELSGGLLAAYMD